MQGISEKLPKSQAFVLLRYTLIIAIAYLLLAEHGLSDPPHILILLVVIALASNVAMGRLPARITETTTFNAGIILGDTLWITAALLYSGRFRPDFFYVYFFVLLLAAIGENLFLIALGAIVACSAYFYVLSHTTTPLSLWSPSTLIRVPFLFTAAAFYGYLVDRVRREQQRARAEADTVARLEHEVSERKRAEESLKAAKDYAESLIDSSLDMIISADADRKIVEFNRAAEDAFGHIKVDVVGQPIDILYADPSEALRVRNNLLKDGRFAGEIWNRRKNGESFCAYLSTSVIHDGTAGVVGAVGVSRDITERKRVEDQLRKLSLAVEQSPNIVMITDARGNIEYVNPKFTEMTGYAPKEVIGQNARILKSGFTPSGEYARLWHTLTSGREWRGDFCNKRKNGELYWVSASISPITNAEGIITHFVGIQEDTTERKRAEAALRESEERYRTLFENAPIGLGVADAEGNLLAFNDAILEPGGYTREDITKIQNVAGLYADPNERAKVLETAQRQGFLHQHEVRFKRKDGTYYDALLSLTPVTLEARTGWQAMVQDITERKRADEAIREINETLQALVQASPAGIITLNHEGRIKLWNPAAERMFGWSAQEVLDRPLPFVPQDRREEFQALRARVLEGKALTSVELRRQKKDGSPIDVSLSAAPLRNAEDQIIGIIAVVTDITERKRAEEALRVAQLQLIQSAKFESVGQLAAGVAHEVKNPLAIILQGLAYLSQDELAPGDGTVTLVLNKMRDAVRRADLVIRGLLDFSTPRTADPTPTNLNGVLEQSLSLVHHECVRSQVTVVKKLETNLPPLKLDRNKIEQVFVNLFMNAIQAMPGGGTLTITTRPSRPTSLGTDGDGRKTDASRIETSLIVVEIEDTGTGIPEGKLDRVFDPFFTTKPVGQGTGLGLSVTRKIVELHGGTIDLRNRDGGGVRVTLAFKTEGDQVEADAPTSQTRRLQKH